MNIHHSTKAYVWHPAAAGCYLSCSLLTTVWGVDVSTCMGDGGPTWEHTAPMDTGSASGLGTGKGAAIMGTTAYWWYWSDSCCTAANCNINQNTYESNNDFNAIWCCSDLMVTWLQKRSTELSSKVQSPLGYDTMSLCVHFRTFQRTTVNSSWTTWPWRCHYNNLKHHITSHKIQTFRNRTMTLDLTLPFSAVIL